MTHSEHKTTLDFIVGEFCYRTAVDHNNIPGLWEECARVESAWQNGSVGQTITAIGIVVIELHKADDERSARLWHGLGQLILRLSN